MSPQGGREADRESDSDGVSRAVGVRRTGSQTVMESAALQTGLGLCSCLLAPTQGCLRASVWSGKTINEQNNRSYFL